MRSSFFIFEILMQTVTSKEGVVYTFALISNGSEVLAARAALDALTTALR